MEFIRSIFSKVPYGPLIFIIMGVMIVLAITFGIRFSCDRPRSECTGPECAPLLERYK